MELVKMSDAEYWISPADLAPIADRTTDRRASLFRIGADGTEAPIAEVLEMPPNYVIVRHAHKCHRFEVVTRGAMYVNGRILGPGDITTAAPGEFYGPKVAGPDGCVAIEIFAEEKGVKGPIIYELPDGSTVDVNYLNGDKRPEDSDNIKRAQQAAAKAFAELNSTQG